MLPRAVCSSSRLQGTIFSLFQKTQPPLIEEQLMSFPTERKEGNCFIRARLIFSLAPGTLGIDNFCISKGRGYTEEIMLRKGHYLKFNFGFLLGFFQCCSSGTMNSTPLHWALYKCRWKWGSLSSAPDKWYQVDTIDGETEMVKSAQAASRAQWWGCSLPLR